MFPSLSHKRDFAVHREAKLDKNLVFDSIVDTETVHIQFLFFEEIHILPVVKMARPT